MIAAGKFPFCPNTILHILGFSDHRATLSGSSPVAHWIESTTDCHSGTKIERVLKEYLEFTVVSDLFMTRPPNWLIWCFLQPRGWSRMTWFFFTRSGVSSQERNWLNSVKPATTGTLSSRWPHRLGLHEAFPWRDSGEYLDWVLEDTGLNFKRFCERDILLGEMRYRKYESEGFQTPTGKFEISSGVMEAMGVSPMPFFREPPLSPVSTPELAKAFPLILISAPKSEISFIQNIAKLNR